MKNPPKSRQSVPENHRTAGQERKTAMSPTKQTIQQRKYDEQNCARCDLKLNRIYDAPILAMLASVPSKQGYIKALIRQDIEQNHPEFLQITEYAGKR